MSYVKKNKNPNICIIGLGYVGIPLAVEFSNHYKTFGYDINKAKVTDLKNGIDPTQEVSKEKLKNLKKITFTNDISITEKCSFFIVTVPTPVTKKRLPDLKSIKEATNMISRVLKKGDIVVYESTVYPGTIEEVCVPILEEYSKLKYNKDFFCGYSPERINPGDQKHSLKKINKIVSGSNKYSLSRIKKLYSSIIGSKVILSSSIKEAEAAKVIENIQRDLNIALMNELSIIFNKLEINTNNVLRLAETKWNFHSYNPGLVGGHCIGVDPYYLIYAAKKKGLSPKIITAGRKLNDHMVKHVYDCIIKKVKEKRMSFKKLKILMMGLTFKENVPDFRNSKSIELLKLLNKNNLNIDIMDPYINQVDQKYIKNCKIVIRPKEKYYDVLVLSVLHDQFIKLGRKRIESYTKSKSIICDIKNFLDKKTVDVSL